ncbi:MAG: hypothetical protein V3T77_03650, partial [Planctomycetota bacterium]
MTSVLDVAWVALFHLPLVLGSYLLTRRFLATADRLELARDTFLVGCVLWRLETLILHATGNIDAIAVLCCHFLILGAAISIRRPQEN